MNVYEKCPVLQNERFLLRFVSPGDAEDLLKVYSDEKAVPLFNSDNCNGDDFHYTTLERMREAIGFWDFSYKEGYFVRWSVIDKSSDTAFGTIELFNRQADDYFNNCGLLRLDLRSDYEKADIISDILGIIVPRTFEMFGCNMTAAKAIPEAAERIAALKSFGFVPSGEKIIGHEGQTYGDYFVMRLKQQ